MRAHRDAGASTRAWFAAVATPGSEMLSPRDGQGSTVGVDDEQAFAVHLVIAVDQTLQGDVRYRGCIGQRSELPAPFRGECRGSAVRQAQRQGDCEGRYREKR